MKQTIPIAELRVGELLARISSNQISPGAGAAGAVALAMAAACAGKAVAISLKHKAADQALTLAATRFGDIARLALTEADRDAVAFEGFIHAKTQEAAAALVREGETVEHAIDLLLAAIDAVEPSIAVGMAGDLAAARALARAARCIEVRNEAEAREAEQSI